MAGRQADAGSVTYKIIITPTAMELLHAIPDRRVQKTIAARINRLAKEPEKQGKPLLGELATNPATTSVTSVCTYADLIP